MSSLLPIGQFVQLTGLSARMVRFYEKLGILVPTKVEPHNSYRYYDYEQTMQAEKIRLLRSLEMPLEEIKLILETSDPGQVRARLEQHRQHIEDKIAGYRKALAALEMLESSQGTLYPVQIKEVPEQTYLSLHFETPLSQVDAVRVMALERLQRYALEHHLTPVGAGFAILGQQDDSPQAHSPDIHHYEFGLPLGQIIPASPPIAVKHLPSRTVASVVHIGPYEPLHLAFRELNLWCHQHGRQHQRVLEIYHTGPLETANPNSYRTEVQYVLGGER
ncbi:MAG: MerR family transcriptional regulator [Meiothermus sp.]|nr:MerR family transcriptional regulator [Meiothermus sp.]